MNAPRILAVMILGFSNLTAYTPQPTNTSQFTDGLLNGRSWIALPDMYRAMFVAGFRDATKYYDDSLRSTRLSQDSAGLLDVVHVPGLNNEDLSAAVTAFYTDSTNRNIPVISAIAWVRLKAIGGSQRDLDGYAAGMRSAFNK